jgi:hypothetical protein
MRARSSLWLTKDVASPEWILLVLQAPAQLSHTTNTFEEL